LRRRTVLGGLIAVWGIGVARAERRRYRIGLANLDETPGVTLDGLGFTGVDIRSGFELAARQLPVDMVYFDNAGDAERAVANADAAIAAHVDLLIEYNADAEANAEIETIAAADAIKLKDDPNILLVDIRDIRELDRDGRIAGALHAPRGMLEFWVDPETPYHREVFASGKKFLFF